MAVSYSTPSAEQIAQPETLLKKRKQTQAIREEKLAKAEEARKARKASRKVIFKRADQYVKEYLNKEKEEIRLKREARKTGDFYVAAQPKVYFVIRIKGISKIAPKPRKILQLLRLLQINNGVFVRVTKATEQMLRLVEPYITYGPPNVKTIKELIYKRGYAKVDGQRIPITDNSIIEKKLGQHGIICMEDIVNEIFTCGPHFKEVSRFLWPFKLSNPSASRGTTWRGKKFMGWSENGDLGNREEAINKLVHSMV